MISIIYEDEYDDTLNSKIVGISYIVTGMVAGFSGFLYSIIIRSELNSSIYSFLAGDFEAYNACITIHAITMIFFFIMPITISGFGNIYFTLLLGSADMAFPRLNTFTAGLNIASFHIDFDEVATGWTLYPPLSDAEFTVSDDIDDLMLALQISGVASLIGAINFIVSFKNCRAPGLTLVLVPLYCWSLWVTSVLLLLALPVLSVGLLLLGADRDGSTFFDITSGGDILLFQHLFWFFGHPEVYILILPSFGIISFCISSLNDDDIFGHLGMIYAMCSLGFLGLLVWGHHMFTTGFQVDLQAYFTIITSIIAIPTAIKLCSWSISLDQVRNNTAILELFIGGFLWIFAIGGISGITLANGSLDIAFHDTLYVVAHFHYVLAMGAVSTIFCMMYLWVEPLFSINFNFLLGYYHFLFFFLGANLLFLPMHFLGLGGMPRRVSKYPLSFEEWNIISNLGFLFICFSLILCFIQLWYCFFKLKFLDSDHISVLFTNFLIPLK